MRLGGGRIYILSYADDMVLWEEEEGEIGKMMERNDGVSEGKGSRIEHEDKDNKV